MTKVKSCHLFDILAKLKDPRKDKGKRHPLKSILALMVIRLMWGHKGWTSIATWARSQPALAKVLGFTHKRIPAASTIHYLLKRLDVVDSVSQVAGIAHIGDKIKYLSSNLNL